MKKYAVDLTNDDKIIDKRTERVVVIEWIEDAGHDKINVVGFFEDDGEEYDRVLDLDSIVRMA